MPPSRTTATASAASGRKPFKPPRPSTSTAKTHPASKPASSRPSGTFFSQSLNDSQDPMDEDDLDVDLSPNPQETAQSTDDAASAKIPAQLLTRLLHEFADESRTGGGGGNGLKMGPTAMAAVGKYMDVFVREAIARAVVERREADERGGLGGLGGGFLEVEDLEKLAPQLLLDF